MRRVMREFGSYLQEDWRLRLRFWEAANLHFAGAGALLALIITVLLAAGWEIVWSGTGGHLVVAFLGIFLLSMFLIVTPFRMWAHQRRTIETLTARSGNIDPGHAQIANTRALEAQTAAIKEQTSVLARRSIAAEREAGELALPMGLIASYEKFISELGSRDEILQRLIQQYEDLKSGLAAVERFSGPHLEDKLAAAEHVLNELKVAKSARVLPRHPGQPLLINTSANTFRVTFGVPMRIAPNLRFFGIPEGVQANVIEKSAIGFTVVFSPAAIPVGEFEFEADARL